MIYKRKELDNIFAIKGFYEFNKKNPPKTVSGAIEYNGNTYRYKIDGCSVAFSENDIQLQDAGKELFSDEWLLINPTFDWNGLSLSIVSDYEFEQIFEKSESSDIKIINSYQEGQLNTHYFNIAIDFKDAGYDGHIIKHPMSISVNGEKKTSNFLMWLGSKIMECSRPDDNWQQEPATKKQKSAKPSRSGFVYLMIDKNTGYHKIGFSKNPKHREKTLQSEKPTIELLHKFKGTMAKEKELHNKYDTKRIRGEWFNLNKEDIKYIKTL